MLRIRHLGEATLSGGPDPARAHIGHKLMRYLHRLAMLPHRTTEALETLRRIEAVLETPAPAAMILPATANDVPAATPGEIYTGYGVGDLWVFKPFLGGNPQPEPGFITDFMGTRTRTASLWDGVQDLDGRVMGRPVPHDLFEACEWIGVLKAVLSAQGGRIAIMELGAGWGPWIVAAAVAARLRGITDIHLLGVEADPGRFALMRQHLIDNGLDPASQTLLCAAVGVEAGQARWPRIVDPANAAGARPVRDSAAGLDAADTDYMGGGLADFIDVDILPMADLLARQPVWDLVHIDVQGWETQLCAGCIDALNERVRWLLIGTHSRTIDGEIIAILFKAGWVLEHEKPTRFRFNPAIASLEQMAEVDGVQAWRNPRLADALRPDDLGL